jgi:hypothetical protein
MLANYIPHATFGLIVALVGIIYRSLVKRIDQCENNKEEILHLVLETNVDVKHIKKHCSRCNSSL